MIICRNAAKETVERLWKFCIFKLPHENRLVKVYEIGDLQNFMFFNSGSVCALYGDLVNTRKAFLWTVDISSRLLVVHTAPQRCQPDRLGTLDFLLVSCYCDQDMTISVAR